MTPRVLYFRTCTDRNFALASMLDFETPDSFAVSAGATPSTFAFDRRYRLSFGSPSLNIVALLVVRRALKWRYPV
jgi:hypothetical protein